jgi:alpha-glucosidase
MIAFRKAWAPLSKGDLSDLRTADGSVSFQRSHGGQTLFCAFNMTNRATPVRLPEGGWRQDKGTPFTAILDDSGRQVTLPPYQAFFAANDAA